MKSRKIIGSLIAATCAVFMTTALVACNGDKEDPGNNTVELASIAITTAPEKVEYVVGESFSNAGMVVTATYSDESSKAVTTYTWSPMGALAMSDTSITVSYTESGVTKTAIQEITVRETAPEKEISSIEVIDSYYHKIYFEGETFDPANLYIKENYTDGTVNNEIGEKVDIAECTFDKTTLATTDTSVTVTYKGKSASIPVTVYAAEQKKELKIEAEASETNCAKQIVDAPNASGGKCLGGFNSNINGEFDNPEKTLRKSLTFNVTSGATEPITVRLVMCVSSEQNISGNLTKTFNKLFSAQVMNAEGKYEAAGTASIVVEPKSDAAKGQGGDYNDFREVSRDIVLLPGDNHIRFLVAPFDNGFHGTNFDYIKIISVDEVVVTPEAELQKIEVTKNANFVSDYVVGDAFDKSGITVKAFFDKGDYVTEGKDVTAEAVITPATLAAGDTSVTVSYTNGTVTKEAVIDGITVADVTATGIAVSGDFKKAYKVDDVFDKTGMVVTATFNDGSTRDVTAQVTVDKTGKLATTDTKVTVSYGELTADVDITVTEYTGTAYEIGIEGASGTEVNAASQQEAKDFIGKYKYMGGMNDSTKSVNFHFGSSAEQKVRVSAVLAGNEAGTMKLNEIFNINLNGNNISGGIDAEVENENKIAYTYFTVVSFYATLEEGTNTITIKSNGSNGTNFAGLIITPADETTEITAPAATISVKTKPYHKIYFEGETFDPTNLGIIRTTYTANGSTPSEEIKYAGNEDKFSFDKTTLTEQDTFVTVTYEGATAEIPITVYPASAKKELLYEAEDSIHEGFTVTEDTTTGVKYVAALDADATKYIYFNIDSKAEEDVTVRLVMRVSSKYVSGSANESDTFNHLFSVTRWDNGEIKWVPIGTGSLKVEPISDAAKNTGDLLDFREISVDIPLVPGANQIRFATNKNKHYRGTSFDYIKIISTTEVVKADAPVLDKIEVTAGDTAKKTYTAGESFDLTGYTIKAFDNYGEGKYKGKDVTASVTVDPAPLTAGTTSVTISYTVNGVTKTAVIDGITVTEAAASA